MTNRKNIEINSGNSLVGILMLVVVFVALYFIASSIFTLLSWLAPVLLIITAILDHKIILNYGKWLLKLLKDNVLMGIGAVLLTIIGFPVVSGFLFVKALLYRKVNKLNEEVKRRQQGEFIEYEEIDSSPKLELPTRKKEAQKESRSGYEELFEDDI